MADRKHSSGRAGSNPLTWAWDGLVRHIGLVLLCVALVPLTTWAVGSRTTYAAETTLFLKLGREWTSGEGADPTSRLEEALASEIEILTSRSLVREVVRELTVAQLYPLIVAETDTAQEAESLAIKAFLLDLEATPVTDASMIRVSFEHRDPEVAAQALNVLGERFQERHVEIFKDPVLPKLRQRVADAQEALAAAEAEYMEFRLARGLYDLDQQRQLLLAREEHLSAQLDDARKHLAALLEVLPGDERDPLGLTRPEGPPAFEPEPLVGIVRSENAVTALGDWARIRARERGQLVNHLETSRTVQATQLEAESVSQFLAKAVAAEVENAIAVRDDAQVQLARTARELVDLESATQSVRELRRAISVWEARLEAAYGQLEKAQIEAELDRGEAVTTVEVVDAATPPASSAGLGTTGRLGRGLLAGLVLGVLVALLRHAAEYRTSGSREAGRVAFP